MRSYFSPVTLRTVIARLLASAPAVANSAAASASVGHGSLDRARHHASAFCRAKLPDGCSTQTHSLR